MSETIPRHIAGPAWLDLALKLHKASRGGFLRRMRAIQSLMAAMEDEWPELNAMETERASGFPADPSIRPKWAITCDSCSNTMSIPDEVVQPLEGSGIDAQGRAAMTYAQKQGWWAPEWRHGICPVCQHGDRSV